MASIRKKSRPTRRAALASAATASGLLASTAVMVGAAHGWFGFHHETVARASSPASPSPRVIPSPIVIYTIEPMPQGQGQPEEGDGGDRAPSAEPAPQPSQQQPAPTGGSTPPPADATPPPCQPSLFQACPGSPSPDGGGDDG